jgi:ParB-like chromosome segregation protein Spo0J
MELAMDDSTSLSTGEQPSSALDVFLDVFGGDSEQELGHVRVLERTLDSIYPSPENERLYRPVDPKDPGIRALAESIREHGVQESLVITEYRWILSGHRRFVAARLAGLESVPCRVEPFRKDDDPDRFLTLLRECNRQRVKSFAEKVREEVVTTNPVEAYQALIEHRRKQSRVSAKTIKLRGEKRRCAISEAKGPFLAAVREVLKARRKFWPLSDRQVHYALLNDPPLIHASKPDSIYRNDAKCYKALTDLLTRARLTGGIPMAAIADPTRPVLAWRTHADVSMYLRAELDGMFSTYWRDLMQSQPNHVEIIGEKNTILPILRPIAAKYTIPMTIGRGYCSLAPRYEIAERFKQSGKERLILLILSDFDPDGEEIAHSLARSLRDDFAVENITPIKVALTAEQIRKHKLPPRMTAKKSSSNYDRFAKAHGDDVFELEALEPEQLQKVLTEAIDRVIDVETFNHELDRERGDAGLLHALRLSVQDALGEYMEGLE